CFIGQEVEVGAVEFEFFRVGAFVDFVELFCVHVGFSGAVHAAEADEFVLGVAQCALVTREEYGWAFSLGFQLGIYGAAGGEAGGFDVAAGAVPDAALVFADLALREYLDAGVGCGDYAGWGGFSADVGALLGEVGGADAVLLGVGEVGQYRLCVQLQPVRQAFFFDAGYLAKQAVEVGGIDHMRYVAIRMVHDGFGSGHDQWNPDAGLVQGAFGAHRVEGQFERGRVGAVVAGDDDDGVAYRVVLQAAVFLSDGYAGFFQQKADLMVDGFQHVLGYSALLGKFCEVDGVRWQHAEFREVSSHRC